MSLKYQELLNLPIKNLECSLNDLPLNYQPLSENTLKILAGFPLKKIAESIHSDTLALKWESNILPHQTQLPGFALKNIKNAIAVVSGKGGVGKSTISTNLACATAILGAKVGLLDADIYGPSLPTMMGIHHPPSINDEQRYLPPKQFDVECMSMGLLSENGPLIWRGPMLAKALMQMLDQTAWSNLDYLFIDLPPGTGDIPLSLTQKIPLSGAVIVTTPQTIATLDAEKALEMFLKLNIPILGIVSNMAIHECEKCHHQSHIFGQHGAEELAKKYNVPILGQVPLDTSIREQGDSGVPISTLDTTKGWFWQQLALKLTVALSQNPLNRQSKIPPIRQE